MINPKSIKQRSIIAAKSIYKKEIKHIEDAIKMAADNGEFSLTYRRHNLKGLSEKECSSILSVFNNLGFDACFRKNDTGNNTDLFFQWWDNLDEIDLLENYETPEIDPDTGEIKNESK